jgi:AcrR family transcriptional regulator
MSRTPDLLAKISLLRAAEEVFAEKGIALAKVEEITRRASLSKGAFYLHFDSKEEAFKEVVESFLARCTTVFRAPGAVSEETLPEDAEAMLAYTLDRDTQAFEFLWQNRHFLTIVEGCNGPQEYLLDTFLDVIRQNTRGWCEVWQRRGLFRRDLDMELAATLLVGAYRALVRQMIASDARPPIRQWLSDAQTLFVRGLGTDTLVTAAKKQDRHDSLVVARGNKKARHGT